MIRKLFTGLGVLLIIGVVVITTSGKSDRVRQTAVLHKIDLVASVQTINVDTGWSQNNGKTQAGMRLSLDDLRTVTILSETMVDNYKSIFACTDFTTPNACVLLADMLGDAVVWFALVPANEKDGQKFLTFPGLVDMQANGDEGILRNGWVVKLATPVVRVCADRDTSSLREFITLFPDTKSVSTLDLITDNIVRVDCVK